VPSFVGRHLTRIDYISPLRIGTVNQMAPKCCLGCGEMRAGPITWRLCGCPELYLHKLGCGRTLAGTLIEANVPNCGKCGEKLNVPKLLLQQAFLRRVKRLGYQAPVLLHESGVGEPATDSELEAFRVKYQTRTNALFETLPASVFPEVERYKTTLIARKARSESWCRFSKWD